MQCLVIREVPLPVKRLIGGPAFRAITHAYEIVLSRIACSDGGRGQHLLCDVEAFKRAGPLDELLQFRLFRQPAPEIINEGPSTAGFQLGEDHLSKASRQNA